MIKSTCKMCGQPIKKYAGKQFWEHIGLQPRHPATPINNQKAADNKSPVDVSVSCQPTLTDVRVYLMNELPYYERDDKDKYFYIATTSDIDRIAIGLMKMFKKEAGT